MSVLFWVILAFSLGVIEIISITFFPIFFLISALIALVIQVAGGADWIQWAAFGIGGLVLSAILRPVAKRQMDKGPTLRSGIEELVGRRGVVTAPIEASGAAVGTVTIDGQAWSAKSEGSSHGSIGTGADVEILEVRGATLVVAPISTGVLEK
jgi:membrane protein implicated in regulation of membrane protease activity